MKKYMVIIRDSETGEVSATFTDDFRKADNMRMDAEVSMGDFAQIYEWLPCPEFPDDDSLYMWSYKEIGERNWRLSKMTNLLSCTKHATELLEMIERSDVTVLSFNVDLDYSRGDPVARFSIHCWMDEWFWTWAEQYSHERIRTVTGTEMEIVPFLDGQVFAHHPKVKEAES